MVAGLVVALVKPWGTPPPVEPAAVAPASPAAAIGAVPSAAAIPPTPVPSWQCFYSSGWRVFAGRVPVDEAAAAASTAPSPSVDPQRLQPTRWWLEIEPATAAVGPLDPGIPIVRIILEEPPALGYCAPASGSERPPEIVSVTAWSIDASGGTREIELRKVATPGDGDASAQGLFVPGELVPGSAPGWPAGRYVFVVRGASGSYERWFGVEVLPWTGGRQEASPSPVVSPAP